MKSIKEVLGDIQQVFSFDFDYRLVFDEDPTVDHLALMNIFRVMKPELFIQDASSGRRGRPQKSRIAICKSYIASQVMNLSTHVEIRNRLLSDVNLRKICGYTNRESIPSTSVLSRVFAQFAHENIGQHIHDEMIREYVSPLLIGHISRDSTAIHAREKPINTKKDTLPKKKRKRGRPKKGEVRPPKEETTIEKQIHMDADKALQDINIHASWGCKVNSQGKKNHWKGYKLHLDVTDFGLPVTAVLTGANVYDNQVAIPMEKITEQKVQHLYSLMDSAYDASAIRTYITSRERVPIIDFNRRRGPKKELAPAEQQRYNIRSTVERSNSHLKDWLFGKALYVKGPDKVMQHLMFGIIVLTALKILQYIEKPTFIKQAA
jgi:hypothetical protein